MKTLKDYKIFYDAACPMCSVYTQLFVTARVLDKKGRTPYQKMPNEYKTSVDCIRAVDEIALLNQKTGEVHYGIKSILHIIGHVFPLLKPLFRFAPFVWLADKLYKFISYNRRVIISAKNNAHNKFYHDPSFHAGYRIAYLIFTWLVTATILSSYSQQLGELMPRSNFYREFFICGGQMVWQLGIMLVLHKRKTWDYLGNMMTISFAGGLLLLLISGVGRGLGLSHPLVYAGGFFVVVGLMFLEHLRRTGLLGISSILTLSWVLYRIFILLLIF